jgi:nickel transport protein
MRVKIILGLLFFCVLFLYSYGFAHKVNLFVFREGEKISGEGYFANGAPCMKCAIEVYTLKGKKIAQTTTDEKGRFEVRIKEKEPLLVRFIAGEGHLAEEKLEGSIEVASNDKTKENITKKERVDLQNKKDVESMKITNSKNVEIDREMLKVVVKEVISEELVSFKGNFLELKKDLNRVRFQDIIGGIGYIIGILGLLAMLKARKEKG